MLGHPSSSNKSMSSSATILACRWRILSSKSSWQSLLSVTLISSINSTCHLQHMASCLSSPSKMSLRGRATSVPIISKTCCRPQLCMWWPLWMKTIWSKYAVTSKVCSKLRGVLLHYLFCMFLSLTYVQESFYIIYTTQLCNLFS